MESVTGALAWGIWCSFRLVASKRGSEPTLLPMPYAMQDERYRQVEQAAMPVTTALIRPFGCGTVCPVLSLSLKNAPILEERDFLRPARRRARSTTVAAESRSLSVRRLSR